MALDDVIREGIKERAKGFAFTEGAKKQHDEGAGVYSTYDYREKLAALGRIVEPDIEHNYLQADARGTVVPHLVDIATIHLNSSCRHYLETAITSDNIVDVLEETEAKRLDSVAIKTIITQPAPSEGYEDAVKAHKEYSKYAKYLATQDLKGYIDSIRSPAAKNIMTAFANVNRELTLQRLSEKVIGLQNRFLACFNNEDGSRNVKRLADYLGRVYEGSNGRVRKAINVQAGIAFAKADAE